MEKYSRIVIKESTSHLKKLYPQNWFPSAKELNALL